MMRYDIMEMCAYIKPRERIQWDTENVNLSPNRWRVIGGIAAIVRIEAGDGTRDFNDGPCYGSLDLDVEYGRHNIG